MSEGLSYRDAGVDIAEGDAIVRQMTDIVRSTWGTGTLEDFGGFAAAFDPPWGEYCRPHLVAATDGVGTKLTLASERGQLRGIGIDCVAMVVNDLVTGGARPLFFLDYIAAARLDRVSILTIIEGLADGCRQAGCALIGGETAEMPGVYAPGDHEVVGFAVGMVEGDAKLRPRQLQPGDQLIALASSGPHSNGFSLIRRIIAEAQLDIDAPLAGETQSLANQLLEPTRIYVRTLLDLYQKGWVLGAAHITGGGLMGNLNRILPEGVSARVDWDAWERPALFTYLAAQGRVSEEEMRRTFNLGVGMVLGVAPEYQESVLGRLGEQSQAAWVVGEVVADG